MQATIDARNLKPFTKALTCTAKYGDEMMIHAGPDGIVLSALNLAKTAFCSFTYRRSFFQRFSTLRQTQNGAGTVGTSAANGNPSPEGRGPNLSSLKSQLQTKLLLSILKHRNTDKMVEKCDLIIIDGTDTLDIESPDNEDSFESRLIVRLHCKHGIIKTHRLLLNTPGTDEAPVIPRSDNENRILVQARAMKEIIEHFPNSKSTRSDPELVWSFDEYEVRVKSMEKGIDAKGKSQLATELKLCADEFDYYSVPSAPLTLGFFLREFNATITLAEALNISIDFRFTTSVQPIYINAESDNCNMLFIIATNPARGQDIGLLEARKGQPNGARRSASGVPLPQKRALEDDPSDSGSVRAAPSAPSGSDSRLNRGGLPQGNHASQQDIFNGQSNFITGADDNNNNLYDEGPDQSQPLFLASQLSAVQVEAIRESGLGIENMNAEEFAAMLDDEGEEVGLGGTIPASTSASRRSAESQPESASTSMRDELEYDELEEDDEMGPTQSGTGAAKSSEKVFRTLFED